MYQGVATLRAYRSFCDNVCNHIAEVFHQRISGHEISCSIRLSDDDDVEGYITRGRSSNLSGARETNSRPVTTTSGVYTSLCEASELNQVLILNDIDEALRSGTITSDYNLEHYRHEIQSMMITRLNVRQGDKDVLWGFLYISSPDLGVFSNDLKPIVMAVADFLSLSMWNVVESRRNGGNENKAKGKDSQSIIGYHFISQTRKAGKSRKRN